MADLIQAREAESPRTSSDAPPLTGESTLEAPATRRRPRKNVAVAARPRAFPRLKDRHRAERERYPENLTLRVHRALSWLDGAEQLEERGERDGQFLFLWISFNAAYATDTAGEARPYEKEVFREFLLKLLSLDRRNKRLETMVWNEFAGSIRVLLGNKYVHDDFWKFKKGLMTEDEWLDSFAEDKREASEELSERRTVSVLSRALSRIYVMRNQLIHGGATWRSGKNRDQLRDCTLFMSKLVPTVVEIMMDHPQTLWGDACYPVVND